MSSPFLSTKSILMCHQSNHTDHMNYIITWSKLSFAEAYIMANPITDLCVKTKSNTVQIRTNDIFPYHCINQCIFHALLHLPHEGFSVETILQNHTQTGDSSPLQNSDTTHRCHLTKIGQEARPAFIIVQ